MPPAPRVSDSLHVCSLALLVCLCVGVPPCWAQSAPFAEPVPGLSGRTNATIRQITRDGSRVLVTIGTAEAGGYLLVLDTETGEILFDSRPVQTPERPFAEVALSPDGAFLADSARSGTDHLVWLRSLTTGEEQLALRDAFGSVDVKAIADQGAAIAAFSSTALTSGPMVIVPGVLPPLRFASACRTGTPVRCALSNPLTMSADGRYLAFTDMYAGFSVDVDHPRYGLVVADVHEPAARRLPIEHPELGRGPWPPEADRSMRVGVSGNGEWVGFTGRTTERGEPRAALIHRATGTALLAAPSLGPTHFHDLSDDARFVLLTSEYSPITGQQLRVVDRLGGLVTHVLDPLDTPLGRYRVLSAHLSGDGSTVVATLGDGKTPAPTPQRTYIAHLDADRDGMNDAWEATFGLDPSTAADASLDPDADGQTSAQEHAAGTHPNGTPVRHFAEGADGSFFATSVALYNPAPTSVTANLRFLGADGAVAATPVSVPAEAPAFVDVTQLGLPFNEFAFAVESPVPLVAERTMTWDRTGRYGSHSSAGVAAPGMTWHFAEGATMAGFQTFFLLQNPTPQPATVTLHYLLATGTTEMRTHVVPAQSRLTVWANQEGAPLDAAEFATTIVADQPIVAERAMYRDAPGETFAAGSVAAGVAPHTSWFFAEGATGDYFDTYVLIANPGDTPATVHATYVRSFDPSDPTSATPIVRAYTVPARSRLTIWVAREDPALASTQVSTWLTADVPIVAERAMWWPGPTAATWRESHAESGATEGGRLWVAPDLRADADANGWDTFLLVAVVEADVATIDITVACTDATLLRAQRSLNAGRTTLWLRHEFPLMVGRQCAARIESLPVKLGVSPASPLARTLIVVEKAMYRSGCAAGGATLATRLPDPP